jgi:hypothetical protein
MVVEERAMFKDGEYKTRIAGQGTGLFMRLSLTDLRSAWRWWDKIYPKYHAHDKNDVINALE